MTETIQKSSQAAKTEFWAVTTLFTFFIFFYITDGLDGESALGTSHHLYYFRRAGLPFDFFRHYFFPQLVRYLFIYFSFLYLSLCIIPPLLKKKQVAKNTSLVVLVFTVGGVVFSITDTYLKGYLYAGALESDAVDRYLFAKGFLHALSLLGVLALYTAAKYLALYLLYNTDAICKKYPFFRPEGLVAIVVWMMGLLVLGFGGSEIDTIAAWLIIVPSAIFIYLWNFYRIISKALQKRRPFTNYILRNLLLMPAVYVAAVLILTFTTGSDDLGSDFASVNLVFQLLITVPLTWMVFKGVLKGNREMLLLKQQLRQSTANIDLLRSQINPHFLFNALNTIYGTALAEGAERTSDAIGKLGDMMRFMLQENLQDMISLEREVAYLKNYIGLQKLRTDMSGLIEIHAEIPDCDNHSHIAPMLLIPFVENAFKHGISLIEPSYIKIKLEIHGHTLYFDVHNSKHPKTTNDPEQHKSGIGLENVKQRLQLAYPNRHELMIQQTGKDFFIHLTIQLD